MYQGVSNQYKTTCLDTFFSLCRSQPKQKILSDKKMERGKKINLSLADDKISLPYKKWMDSDSLNSKQTPSTTYRTGWEKEELPQEQQDSGLTKQKQNSFGMKIGFNQQQDKSKFKAQTVYPLSSVPLKLGSGRSNSPIYGQQNIIQLEMNRTKHKKSYNFLHNQNINSFQFGKTHNNHGDSTNLKSKQKGGYSCQLRIISEEIKQTLKQLQKIRFDTKNNTNQQILPSTDQTFEKQSKQELFYSVKNQRYSTKELQSRLSSSQSLRGVSQFMVQAPKNMKNFGITGAIKNENKWQIEKKFSNLYEITPTISSKYGSSYQREGSAHFSNVIEKVNIQQLKFLTNNSWKDWNHLKRESVSGNLFDQNERKQNAFRNTENTNIDFKRRKNMASRCSFEPQMGLRKNKNLKSIENLLIQTTSNAAEPVFDKIQLPQDKVKSIYEQFTKLKYLGVGRFASVYLCSNAGPTFIFAMKQILKFTLTINKLENQIQKQIKIQYSCNHPNIINLYHAWSDEKRYYIAMQYGQRTLLNKLEREYMIKEEDCVRYIFEIAKGLEYLHQRGIIHRDIKPENIILVNDMCKIGDFGWAAKLQSGSCREPCGTPCYISPQIFNLEEYTVKADCWSLGILAFQLINGKLDQTYFSKGVVDRDSLRYIFPVSDEYKNLVYQLLSLQERDRPNISQILGWQILKGKQ